MRTTAAAALQRDNFMYYLFDTLFDPLIEIRACSRKIRFSASKIHVCIQQRICKKLLNFKAVCWGSAAEINNYVQYYLILVGYMLSL